MKKVNILSSCLIIFIGFFNALIANPVKYTGSVKEKKGKNLVLIASDHEYRAEETIPALARILAVHHGIDCTVLFGLNKDGEIEAGISNIPGLEALKKADGMVIFTRFLALPPEQMKHIDDYLNRAGPVVGLRTSTHGFNYKNDKDPYYKYHFRYTGKDYEAGLGITEKTTHKAHELTSLRIRKTIQSSGGSKKFMFRPEATTRKQRKTGTY